MSDFTYPHFPTSEGYLTGKIRQDYIAHAVARKVLPVNAHRMADIVSLSASNDSSKPIQFWQLYSVLGPERIVRIVTGFYERVFDDDEWFTSVFARVGGVSHHINTQSAMWVDAMGGGPAYHGGEFRLNFHHTHNAMPVMNERGAERWAGLMVAALDASVHLMTGDERVRPSLNTFLTHFFDKYATDFAFTNTEVFGQTNPPVRRKVNFMNMTSDAIEALSEEELREGLIGRGVDVSDYRDKQQLVNKALSL